MLFFKGKTITNRQTLGIGFVLAVLSMASMALITYVLPMVGAWLNMNGVTELDLFYTAFIFVFLMAVQGLLLFGFPLYYAQDQKSHMTGFRILLATLLWMLILMTFTALIFVKINKGQDVGVDLQQLMQEQGATVPAGDPAAEDAGIAE